MKKKAIVLLAFTAALTAVSCQKVAMKEAETTPTGEGMTISAMSEGIGAGPKADLAYKYDVIWRWGDKICVKNSEKSVEFTLTDGQETTTGTFSSGESISGEVEGFYPTSVANLIWPAEQQNNQVPPMYCKKTLTSTQNQTFSFASLGSVLQLTFSTTSADIVLRTIEVMADEAMSGAFTVDAESKAVISQGGDKLGITLDLGDEGVKVGVTAKKFNIAVPAGEYNNLTITFIAKDGQKCIKHATKAQTIAYNTVNTLAISGEFKSSLPAGALPGVFTVSNDNGETKTPIHFSQGNLVATINASGAPTAWKFATNQFDYLGEGGANKTIGTATGDVDLFGWSTSNTGGTSTTDNYGIKTSGKNSDYSGTFYDWGKAVGDSNTWRTLTTAEWTYLFNTRAASKVGETENARYAKATVNDKAGIILLPDTYDPEGLPTLTSINTNNVAFTVNNYNLTEWGKMESAGAVFLPAAGYRYWPNVKNFSSNGYYWSSTEHNDDRAHRVTFDSWGVYPDGFDYRYNNYSVRLITECQ